MKYYLAGLIFIAGCVMALVGMAGRKAEYKTDADSWLHNGLAAIVVSAVIAIGL